MPTYECGTTPVDFPERTHRALYREYKKDNSEIVFEDGVVVIRPKGRA